MFIYHLYNYSYLIRMLLNFIAKRFRQRICCRVFCMRFLIALSNALRFLLSNFSKAKFYWDNLCLQNDFFFFLKRWKNIKDMSRKVCRTINLMDVAVVTLAIIRYTSYGKQYTSLIKTTYNRINGVCKNSYIVDFCTRSRTNVVNVEYFVRLPTQHVILRLLLKVERLICFPLKNREYFQWFGKNTRYYIIIMLC